MRITWVTVGLGWLAILGVPPFSGFWSKDKIIEAAFIGEGAKPWLLGGIALLGAGLTAYYMSRIFFLTFHGDRRWTTGQHPHEAPALMTVPMIALAVGSAVLGLILGVGSSFTSWLEPVTGHVEHDAPVLAIPAITTLTLLVVAAGLGLAYLHFVSRPVLVEPPPASLVTLAARNDLYQDSVNSALLEYPGQTITRMLVFADAKGVDGVVNQTAAGTVGFGEILRRVQSGRVRSYAGWMLLGVVLLLAIVLKGGV
jgi:NADH-quinone oxidoreductase subunit L